MLARVAVVSSVVALGSSSCHACLAIVLSGDDDPSTSSTSAPVAPAPNAPSPSGDPGSGDPGSGDPAPGDPAPGDPAPVAPSAATGLDGRYACFQLRVVAGPNFTFKTTFVPGALPGFTIRGGTYTSAGRDGTVSVEGSVVSFSGAGYDGWRGATAQNSTGFYIKFRGKAPGDPQPGTTTKSGDYQCYRQRGG